MAVILFLNVQSTKVHLHQNNPQKYKHKLLPQSSRPQQCCRDGSNDMDDHTFSVWCHFWSLCLKRSLWYTKCSQVSQSVGKKCLCHVATAHRRRDPALWWRSISTSFGLKSQRGRTLLSLCRFIILFSTIIIRCLPL